MQIVPAWPPAACKFRLILFLLHATGGHAGTICMRLVATRVQFICDWRPLRYNQSHANLSCASGQLRAKPPVFASTLREQFFDLKNEDAIKKSENLRYTCACQGLSINTLLGPIQSRETVPLSECALFKKSGCVHNFQSGLNLPTSTVQLEMPLYMFFILWWFLWLTGSETAFFCSD
jgi:hypothetical protein